MRIAVVGAGISGLLAAWLLRRRHEVRVYEADEEPGGHVRTVAVPRAEGTLAIDTGFIVFNDRTYPTFTRLLDRLGVGRKISDMSFSVREERSGLEWQGSRDWRGLFARRRNLVSPRFWRMARDTLRFGREAPERIRSGPEDLALGAFLREEGYSAAFRDLYVRPMGSALWSMRAEDLDAFPARTFVGFFENHGLLSLRDRPTWYVIPGGSRTYVDAMVPALEGRLLRGTPVTGITRHEDGVVVEARGRPPETWDAAVVATHSDQALALLHDPSPSEREVLGAVPYQENDAVLHTDPRVMPRARRAWASWNYHVPADGWSDCATVTYWMNRLQGLDVPEDYFVTLNRTAEIDPAKVLARIPYHHPHFTTAARAAWRRKAEIQGVRRTWYAGAYWGFGFHEDGARSGAEVAGGLGAGFDDA